MDNQMDYVSIFNKGKRTWDIPAHPTIENKETPIVHIEPNGSEKVHPDIAEKYTKRYPRDLILGSMSDTKAAKARILELQSKNEELEAENAELKARIEELETGKLSEKDQLILEAEKLGLTVDKRSGVDTLKAIIEKAKING